MRPNIDALWDSAITPVLLARLPGATGEPLQKARAYASGGCVIQDTSATIRSAAASSATCCITCHRRLRRRADSRRRGHRRVRLWAGRALGHYAADNGGHPLAVNRAVPLMYPTLKARFGNDVTDAQAPTSHVLIEFSFDVVRVAGGA